MPDALLPHQIIGTPAYYAYELQRRRIARRSLAGYATAIEIPNVPAEAVGAFGDDDPDKVIESDAPITAVQRPKLVKHHQLICDSFQATASGLHKVEGQPLNLMLLFPPGSAKSTYADIVGVPWFMATRPKGLGGVLLASHSSELATRQGRRARQVIRSKLHTSIFPDAILSSDRGAADNWILSNGAEYLCGGILSGITGNRCALGIADDLIRGREAAESQRTRDKTWEAYSDDFCSRLLPGAPQIMITTRWHQDDPAGRILPEKWVGESGIIKGRDGRWWNVLCVPAIADRADDPLGRKIGETLWPEWFTEGHWEPFKRSARTWTSLYQQKPSAPEGTFFKRAWFEGGEDDGRVLPTRRYTDKPKNLNIYMSSDHAKTEDIKADYTVLRVWGIDERREIFWLDGWRGQARTDVWVEKALDLIRAYKPLCWFPEGDTIFGSVEPFVKTQMRDKRAICRIETLSTKGDKIEKAQSFQGMASLGMVHLPYGLDANAAIEEYVAFPGGKNDDEVDAGSNICRALMDAHPAIVQGKAQEVRRDPWGNPLRDDPDDWRTA